MNLLVMAKSPEPGRVKTRLAPLCSPEESAALAEAALADTLEAAALSGAERVIVALDGPPGAWLPPRVEVVDQVRGDFCARLSAAWAHAGGPTLQIGMDTPQVTAGLLDKAMADLALAPGGCAIGLAADGGWWALGMQRAEVRVFSGVEMSRASTGASQIEGLRREVGPPVWLPPLADFDTAIDVVTVASHAPGSRLAKLAGVLRIKERVSSQAWLRETLGSRLIPLPADVWGANASPAEGALLGTLDGPVLDVGCGPGRHLELLASLGVPALGVDTSPLAVGAARRRGASVLERSVFATIPGEGRYESAILLDGNIGIGGDPVGLLRRVAEVLRPGGTALVETGPPGGGLWRGTVRVERGDAVSRPFAWAEVGADALDKIAGEAGFVASDPFSQEGRWYGLLRSRAN